MPNATSTTTAIVEILEPPDIWGDVASELDALVQDGVPLPEQRLENMIEFYCPPKFLLLMNDRTRSSQSRGETGEDELLSTGPRRVRRHASGCKHSYHERRDSCPHTSDDSRRQRCEQQTTEGRISS